MTTRGSQVALVCPDKFRGSATAAEAASAIAAGLHAGGYPGKVTTLPVADGGEGTIDCFATAGFRVRAVMVTGPLQTQVHARFATRGELAVIEAAQACGLDPAAATPDNALHATTRGVGELIGHVLDLGYRKLTVGVGGTAATDGGAGLLQALGASLLDHRGQPLEAGGAHLHQLRAVDLTHLDPRLHDARITVATDVDNPLLGPRGAAAVFAPQKGAESAGIDLLTQGLVVLNAVLQPHLESGAADAPGAGAGGGIGYALIGVVAAQRHSGAETVLDLLGFDSQALDADLIIVGEGSLDQSSLHGKAPAAIARRADALDARVVAVAGRCTLTERQWRAAGIDQVWSLSTLASSYEQSVREAGDLLIEVGVRIARQSISASGGPALEPAAIRVVRESPSERL